MGLFNTGCLIENQQDRSKKIRISKLLVDTGSELTWINQKYLEKIGIEQEKKDIFAGDYILYLASFRNQNYAEKEVEMLKRRGHNASFKRRGSWYQIYIAGYPSLPEARKAKKALDSQYKDSYIGKTNGAR